jgi:aryl-alcohol dehydrogenase-like predicted oxidoreductase
VKNDSRLILGTVQLGLPYGIGNKTGQPDEKLAQNIVQIAWECGIREFDTGQAYGVSEEILGKAFKNLGISQSAKIISKPHPDLDHISPDTMLHALEETLTKLGQESLNCYMLHREALLDAWDHGLGDSLKKFLSKNLIHSIGISVYSPDRALQALKTKEITVIQLPTNILDRRFERAGVFGLAERLGKTVQIRSAYLQGLILMDPNKLPEGLKFASTVLCDLEHFASEAQISKKELAIGYLKASQPQAKVVIGAELPQQILENCAIWEKDVSADICRQVKSRFSSVNEKILTPSLWKL